MKFEEAVEIVKNRLLVESSKLSNYPFAFESHRKCSEENCSREWYASGYCNAHYIRSRKSMKMDAPIKNRKASNKCLKCEAKLNGKGGWNLCQSHYNKKRRYVIKSELVKIFGSKCSRCSGRFSDPCFDFHHLGDKTEAVSELINNASVEKIVSEAMKCVMICANCHREVHSEENF